MCMLKERDMHTFGCLCWLYQVWGCKSLTNVPCVTTVSVGFFAFPHVLDILDS